MSQTAWIRSDLRAEGITGREEIRGVNVSVKISPYDLPTAFRGAYDSDRGVFRIEFQYIDDEVGEKKPGDGFVSFEVGQFSQKLLAIEVAVDRHQLNVVSLDLDQRRRDLLDQADQSLEGLKQGVSRPSAKLNYNAVDQLLKKNRDNPQLLTAAR